jgi:hypothetical protein
MNAEKRKKKTAPKISGAIIDSSIAILLLHILKTTK